MIWFVTRQICIFIYYWYKYQKSPAPSSINAASRIDRTLSEWTIRLVHRPLLPHDNWFVKRPTYLPDCYPMLKTMTDDPDTPRRLHDLSPIRALSYLFLRRVAEAVVQLISGWLLTIWIVILVISLGYTWFISKQNVARNKTYIEKYLPLIWNLKRVWLLLCLVPLSFLTIYIYDSGFKAPQLQRDTGVRQKLVITLYNTLMPSERKHELANIFDLLQFSSLYREIYGDDEPSGIDDTVTQKICRATKVSLAWWSVFIFVTISYGMIALALYVFVWFPLKNVFSRFYGKDPDDKIVLPPGGRSKCEKMYLRKTQATESDDMLEKCFKVFLDIEDKKNLGPHGFTNSDFFISGKDDGPCKKTRENLKHESVDVVPKHNLKYRPPKSALKPRYVSRGVNACL